MLPDKLQSPVKVLTRKGRGKSYVSSPNLKLKAADDQEELTGQDQGQGRGMLVRYEEADESHAKLKDRLLSKTGRLRRQSSKSSWSSTASGQETRSRDGENDKVAKMPLLSQTSFRSSSRIELESENDSFLGEEDYDKVFTIAKNAKRHKHDGAETKERGHRDDDDEDGEEEEQEKYHQRSSKKRRTQRKLDLDDEQEEDEKELISKVEEETFRKRKSRSSLKLSNVEEFDFRPSVSSRMSKQKRSTSSGGKKKEKTKKVKQPSFKADLSSSDASSIASEDQRRGRGVVFRGRQEVRMTASQIFGQTSSSSSKRRSNNRKEKDNTKKTTPTKRRAGRKISPKRQQQQPSPVKPLRFYVSPDRATTKLGDDIEDIEDDATAEDQHMDLNGRRSDEPNDSKTGTEFMQALTSSNKKSTMGRTLAELAMQNSTVSEPSVDSDFLHRRKRGSSGGNSKNAAVRFAETVRRARQALYNRIHGLQLWESHERRSESNFPTLTSNPWLETPSLRVYVKTAVLENNMIHVGALVQNDLAGEFAAVEDQREFFVRGRRLDIMIPRAPGILNDQHGGAAYSSPSFKYNNKRQQVTSTGVEFYHMGGKKLMNLGHLENLISTDDLPGHDLSIHWPWSLVKETEFLIAPGLVRIHEGSTTAPSPIPVTELKEQERPPFDPPSSLGTQEEGDSNNLLDDVWDEWVEADPCYVTPRKIIEEISGRVVCSVMRDVLFEEVAPEKTLHVDGNPAGGRWSSLLLQRTNGDAKEMYCHILIPPQYVVDLKELLWEDEKSCYTLYNLKFVGMEPVHGQNSVPALMGGVSIRWGSYGIYTSQVSMPVLCVDSNTSARKVEEMQDAAPRVPRVVMGTVTPVSFCRASMICRWIHWYGNSIFALDISNQNPSQIIKISIEDAKIQNAISTIIAKGQWIMCRDLLFENGAFVLDSISMIELLSIHDNINTEGGTSDNQQRDDEEEDKGVAGGTFKLAVHGNVENLITCTYYKEADGKIAQEHFEGPSLSNRRITVPILGRQVQFPGKFQQDLRATLKFFPTETTIKETVDQIYMVQGEITHIGIAQLGPMRNMDPGAWKFTTIPTTRSFTVKEAMEIAREAHDRDIALGLFASEFNLTIRIRVRKDDLLGLIPHATLLNSLRDMLPTHVALPCLITQAQRQQFQQLQSRIHTTSLSLLDEHKAKLFTAISE